MPRRDLLFLFALALLFNFGAASFIRAPGYVDDAYYFGGALRLAQGQGFTEPYLWNYLGDPQSLPQPSHLYWMPLTSIVAALSMAAFGQSFAAARFPLLLLASLLPLITYHCSLRATGLHRHAFGAGLLTIFSGFYPAYWGTTDSFALYGLIGGATLLAISHTAESRDWRWAFAAGVGAGLAHLTRADGILLLAVGGSCVVSGKQPFARRPSLFIGSLFIVHSSLFIVGYLLATLPWLIRNMLAVGSPLGRGGASALWLLDYNDLFNYPPNLTPQRYFAAGWAAILDGKWQSLLINLQTIIGVQGLVFLTPFIALGLWQLRRHTYFRPALLYAAMLYIAMTLAFSLPGARGGLFHSSAALMPFYFAACFAGLDAAIDWAAARLKHWQPEKAKLNFSILTIAMAAILTLAMITIRLKEWNGGDASFREIGAAIPGDAVVMSNNPPGFWVATGHPGIPLVNGDVSILLLAADRFNARYVLLDHNIPAGLGALYASERGERLQLVNRWGEWKLFEVAR
ncbi:MAG: glycosyltransferase family 39 protein [Chloroflexi bacterium]|nr:glycosyltransferase family 39 protein [Chloroflexota bacterium]